MVAAVPAAADRAGDYLSVSRKRVERALIDALGLEFCRQHSVCPLGFEEGRLVVATPRAASARAIRLIEQRVRQPVTVRPSTRGEVLLALANASGEEPYPADLRAALARVLIALELVDHRLGDAYAVAAEGEAYLGASLVEAGALTETERVEAIGLAFHLPSIDVVAHPPTPGLETALGDVPLPSGTVPLWVVGDELFLGCRAPLSGIAASALEDALGLRVRPVLMLRAAARVPSAAGASAAHASNANRSGQLSVEDRSTRLLEAAGFADLAASSDEVRTDALALREGLPRVRDLARFRDAAARERPGQVHAEYAARLLLDHDLVTVAVESLEDLEPFERAGEATQAAIVDRSGVAAVERTWGALGTTASDERVVAFARELQLRHGVSRLKVLDLFQQLGEAGSMPMDRVVARFGEVTSVDACLALAAALHTQPAGLQRIEVRAADSAQPSGAALGLHLQDPVDHEVARRLSLEQSDALGAVPYARAQGTLLVAVADPLSTSTAAELTRLLSEDFEARPAWRLEIAEAARRAHGRPSVGEFLLEQRRINPAQLRSALLIVDRANVSLPNALRSLGVASETEIAQAGAQRSGLPFFELGGITLSRAIAALLPEALARAEQMLPIGVDGVGEVTVAVADPENTSGMDEVRSVLEGHVRFVVTTRADVRDALERLYHGLYAEIAATRLRITAPENSADRVLTRPQQMVIVGSALAFIILAAIWTIPVVTVAMTFTTAFYLTFAGYKFYLIFRSLSHELAVPVSVEDVAALADRDLPVYTILVPLYRETEVLPLLVRSLSRLDYPKEKLDVKLLLEEDDIETIAAARASDLPAYFDLTVVPNGLPKGKPKACNYGLLHARGEYVVIFDAEDVPDPDQLKRVLIAFSRSPEDVVCIQAKLSYYNRNQNILTRWFTAEYALWFDLLLPGLDASGAPIPLGGTSNHFKTTSLLEAGAWDPYNVTEDADLGLRIFKAGGRTAVVDSTTYEEANSVLDNWVRQRSRWVKGYIQTYLVHMRNPLALWRALGPAGFLSFQLVIGGTAFSFLYNPVLWLVTAIWFATRWDFIYDVFPPAIYYVGAIALFVGNFAFAYANVVGCLRRRYYPLVGWALLSPIYWLLMSVAAWKGFLQLFYRPFYWEKTVHGLATQSSLDDLARLTEREERTP